MKNLMLVGVLVAACSSSDNVSYEIRVKSADVPPFRMNGSTWDPGDPIDGEGAPDVYVTISIDSTEVGSTPVVIDDYHPEWDFKTNVVEFSTGGELQATLFDDDDGADETVTTCVVQLTSEVLNSGGSLCIGPSGPTLSGQATLEFVKR